MEKLPPYHAMKTSLTVCSSLFVGDDSDESQHVAASAFNLDFLARPPAASMRDALPASQRRIMEYVQFARESVPDTQIVTWTPYECVQQQNKKQVTGKCSCSPGPWVFVLHGLQVFVLCSCAAVASHP